MSYLRIRKHYRGVWFEPENAPKKTLLVHNSSSGSAVIKKSLKEWVYTPCTLEGSIGLKMHYL